MISALENLTAKSIAKKLRFLPYALVGCAVFAFNNVSPETNPYLQVYVTILEAQLGIAVVYILTKKLGNMRNEKHSS
jgi:hypothetical protein